MQTDDVFSSLFSAAKRQWKAEGGDSKKKPAKGGAAASTAARPGAARPGSGAHAQRQGAQHNSSGVRKPAFPPGNGAARGPNNFQRRPEAAQNSRPVQQPQQRPPAHQQAAQAAPRREASAKGPSFQRPPREVEQAKPQHKAPARDAPAPALARQKPKAAAAAAAADPAAAPREKRDRSREKERKQKRKERLRAIRGDGVGNDGGDDAGDAEEAEAPAAGSRGGREGGKRPRDDAAEGTDGGAVQKQVAALVAAAAAAGGSFAAPGKKQKQPKEGGERSAAASPAAAAAAVPERPAKKQKRSAGDGDGDAGAAGPSGRPAAGASSAKAAARESRSAAEARVDADSVGKAARARQQKMLSAIRSRGESAWGADDEGGGGDAGDGDGGGDGGKSSKLAKKMKARQALLLKPELVTPAEKSGLSFEAEWHDHCETPFEAYQHIEPILFKLAQVLGKSKEELRIYDPYYCEGSMVKHLGRLGFTNVYNKNEDFYAVVERGLVPEHDVLVTNPPYSADHMQRCLRFCMANGRPWLLCLPNFVYRKRDYQTILGQGVVPFYLCPPRRYVYYAPGRQQEKTQATSPFDSFWYCYLEPCGTSQEKFAAWFENKYAKVSGCRLARTPEDLPEDVVPVRLDKRPNPKARRRAQKRAAFIHKQFGVPMKHIRGGPGDERG